MCRPRVGAPRTSVRGSVLSTELYPEAPPSVFNEARRAARPVRRSAHFVSIRVADAGRGRPRPGGCGTGRTAMRSSKICVESGLRAPVVDPANLPRDTRRSTRPSRPSGRRSRTSQERPNPGWIKDRPPHHRVALPYGDNGLGPQHPCHSRSGFQSGPAPLLNMHWLGISIDSFLYNKC